MLTWFILFLMTIVSFIHADREKLNCTLTISRNTENSKDHTLFLHVEKFLLQHETGEVLSGFLDKGNLTVGIRYIISPENDIKLDYLFLKIKASTSDKHFLASAMHNMDKTKFLTSVKNALYKAYYDTDSKEKSNENFNAMMEDNVIGSYLRKIKTRPLIMYTEMSVTSVGIELNLTEISSANNDTCFLKKLHKGKTNKSEAEDGTTSSNGKHTLQLKLRSFDDSEDSDENDNSDDETSSPCAGKKKPKKKKNKSRKRGHIVKDENESEDDDDDKTSSTCASKKKAKKKKTKSKKRGHIVKDEKESEDDTDDTDDVDEDDETESPCSSETVSTKQKAKKRNIVVKKETKKKCSKNKKVNKQKNVKVVARNLKHKRNKNQTKKSRTEVKIKSESQSNAEMEETEDDGEAVDGEVDEGVDASESAEFETRSIKKSSTPSTDSKLFKLLVNEINNASKNNRDKDENTENEYTEDEKEEELRQKPGISVKRKSVSKTNNDNNKSAKKTHKSNRNQTKKHRTQVFKSESQSNAEMEETEDDDEEGVDGEEVDEKESPEFETRSLKKSSTPSIDIETNTHITEHLVNDGEGEKHQTVENDNEEESDESKEEDEDDAEMETDEDDAETETDEEETENNKNEQTDSSLLKVLLKNRKLDSKKSESCKKTCCPCDDE